MALELKSASRIVKGQVFIQPTDLVLEKGTMNVLLGPTLSGKTSLTTPIISINSSFAIQAS